MAKYKKEIVDRICELFSSDTYTIAEVCQIVGISESTFHEWKSSKSEFSESIKRAENARTQLFIVEAKKSLLKKIQGYTVQEKHTTYVNVTTIDENGNLKETPRVKEQKIAEKYFQPETPAIIFALTNADPHNWKRMRVTEHKCEGGEESSFGTFLVEVIDSRSQVRTESEGN